MASALHRWGARALRDAIAARQLSATEVTEAHLRQIEATNADVNAIVTLAADQALAQAQSLDRQSTSVGPLHGVPVAIKDLVNTAGIRTTYGSPIYANHIPDTDELIVTRLRNAGAVILGKTNTPEFGAGSHTFNEVFGPTRNPWALGLSAGGSSGGAAAALAAGMVPIADGSDLGGSLRNPAAFCGVVGVRPSPGRVPSINRGDPWSPHSVLGPMARSVDDAALVLSVIAGPDSRAALSIDDSPTGFARVSPADLKGLRIAWSETVDGLPVEPEITAALRSVRQTLVGLGAEVHDVEPDLCGADEVFETFRSLGMLSDHAEEIARWPDLVKPEIHAELRWAQTLTVGDIVRATRLRAELLDRMVTFMARYDLLALPATQVLPFDVSLRWPAVIAGVKMERYYDWMRTCSRITSTTLPALSIPGAFTEDGLPVGLQLVGRLRGDHALLAQAAAVEAALGLPTLAPLA